MAWQKIQAPAQTRYLHIHSGNTERVREEENSPLSVSPMYCGYSRIEKEIEAFSVAKPIVSEQNERRPDESTVQPVKHFLIRN